MKRKILYSLLVGAFMIISCENENEKVYLSANPAPPEFLAPTDGTSIIFKADDDAKEFIFTWKEADLGVKTSITYTIQFDTSNFTDINSKNQIGAPTTNDSLKVTYKDMNKKITGLNLNPNVEKQINVRIRANINDKSDTIYSKAISLKVTPY
jgi:hypothetical protein